ncbi:M28 family metallopeptidase [Kordiimonas marina]|uniref:M28 family metallopeptidase n=1 Tax=Kordiimonas marina TaxID=2872312 RepID=UPI001FF60AB9|nr:M28 family metallopeptidase [Kordiimonas marina]MCJ9428092.1 M28 family peptidase [Kordiimonas marina]
MKKFLLASGLALALAACGNNGAEGPSKPYQMNAKALGESIKTLASDKFGGRGVGTEGEKLTVAYMTKQFKDAGLLPANGDSYTQDVPLVSIEALGNPDLKIEGNGQSLDFKYRHDEVVWTRHEVPEMSVKDSDLVFVGYGINAPERGWNDYAGVDVKGKTVVMLVNDPGYATQDPKLFGGNAMTYYGRWDYKYDEAARQGAAGAIIIHRTKPAAYPWATVDSSWTGPKMRTVQQDKGAHFTGFEAWITTDAADKLFAAAGLDRAALEAAAEKPGFKAVPMGDLKVSTSFKNEVKHVTSHNIAAYVKGTEHPDEVFVYMAHWDHLGTDPTMEGDNIYNGALDNASGSAGLIELARAFGHAKVKPKRSVLFLSVTGEEQGLLGSAYYGDHPLFPLAKTVGGLNMDGLNNYGPTKDITIIGLGNSHLDDYIRKAAANQGRVLDPDPEPEKGGFYRSDHFELSKHGVPMLYPESGADSVAHGREWVRKRSEDYTAHNYHKPSDEYHDDWDLSGAIQDLNAYYQTGRMLVDSGDWPTWNDGTEFKKIREEQRPAK